MAPVLGTRMQIKSSDFSDPCTLLQISEPEHNEDMGSQNFQKELSNVSHYIFLRTHFVSFEEELSQYIHSACELAASSGKAVSPFPLYHVFSLLDTPLFII